jgi:hypothetical protein
MAVLAVGGLVGWLVAAAADGPAAPSTASEDPDAGRLADPPGSLPTIDWSEAGTIPETAGTFDGFTGAAQVGNTIYVAARVTDPVTRQRRAILWRSDDSAVWEDAGLDLGAAAVVDQIAAYGDALLLAGSSRGQPRLWKSIPGRVIGGASWIEVPLPEPPGIAVGEASLATSRDGQVVVTVPGTIDLTDRVVADLPAATDLNRAGTEVVVADNRAWTRVVTPDGSEHLATYLLPDELHYVAGRSDGLRVSAMKVWASSNGVAFYPVTGPNIVPSGRFEPIRWGKGFVAAEYGIGAAGNDDATVIWESSRGTAWRPIRSQPSADCVPFSLSVSGERLLAVSDGGVVCLRIGDSPWQLLGTRQSGVGYLTGGDAGFLRYPLDNDYQSSAFSRDGMSWADISIPAAEPYPMIAVLRDRLLTLSVQRRPNTAPRIQIWIGAIG